MNLGANQRNTAALAVLFPIACYMVYSTFFSGDGGAGAPPGRPAPAVVKAPQKLKTIDPAAQEPAAAGSSGAGARSVVPPAARAGNASRRGNTSQEWTPRVGGRRPEDRADPAKTDPTLKLDLLARLQNVSAAAAGRSLFDFTTGPPPPMPQDVKIALKKNGKGGPPAEPPKPPVTPFMPTGPTEPPPPPAIPLKFYGFVQGAGGKRAFFRLGEEEIFMASEGQTIQSRYKIVRIGLSSAMVEDTQFKNNQQSLRIEEIPKENL